MSHPHFGRLTLAAAIVLALSACSKGDQQAGGPGGGQMPPAEVVVATARSGDVAVTRDLTGRVLAYRTAEVCARVEGILEKRLFTEGGEVRAGQTLFQIDRDMLEAAAAAARANLAKANANVAIARQTAERYRALINDQGVSRQELDQAEAGLKEAQANVANAQATLKQAQIDLGHALVTAPISGRIGRAFVTEGALVGKGEATHLATIEQLDPIYVDFTQSGADMLRLKKSILEGKMKATDLPVEIVLEDGSVYPLKGELKFAEQTVDPSTGAVTLRAQFANPDRLLLPGMFATVRFAQGAVGGAVKVPQRAVMANPQGQFVYVVGADKKVTVRPVKTGGFSGQDWVITSGLKNGEKVIVDGLQKVAPGAPVNPVDEGAKAAPQAQKAPAPAQQQ
ncbi:efflux RND transporter periplasmic adaptor subunit [Chitiniphilus purpureus]|uniref:Efflux RND transporter periplasmic adaptor subunit n=1 Tax=Chitiniphilus purpureus TaxID=2981137 RepID=A0ABY6DHD0_9NEIS|nr:efflux RND transporter periplasmic adaptor subunit [Chitiniphilus sp. CD1]UXY13749.1 efflux RND transporter periplasmic adaptor subunit [Chitiniphilus sp. CD1]